MKVWLLICLLHALLAGKQAEAKRFDPFMVDPLMRRSSLDKNFMRFGRSSPSYSDTDDIEQNQDSQSEAETSKSKSILVSGRSKNENFMRFGRGKQDNLMRFGRSKSDSFMRFGKGKQDSYMRFGRGKQDNFMRFGRGKQDNLMRFGRGKQDNFMRFGRGKQDNFMRFGKGKQDNFMRFGRKFEEQPLVLPALDHEFENDFLRDTRTKQGNFMRFGRDPDIDIVPRPGRAKHDSFMRFGKSLRPGRPDFEFGSELNTPFFPISRGGRAKESNFMRFGKYDSNNNEDMNQKHSLMDIVPEKRSDTARPNRALPVKDDSFMRFGRNSEQTKENSIELIPQRMKRSIDDNYTSQEELYPSQTQGTNNHIPLLFSTLPFYVDEVFSPTEVEEDYNNRRKRSLSFKLPTSTPLSGETHSAGNVPAKTYLNTSAEPEFQTSLISAGLPNVIVGPEFSLLPDMNPPPSMRSGNRPGDQNFLRLG